MSLYCLLHKGYRKYSLTWIQSQINVHTDIKDKTSHGCWADCGLHFVLFTRAFADAMKDFLKVFYRALSLANALKGPENKNIHHWQDRQFPFIPQNTYFWHFRFCTRPLMKEMEISVFHVLHYRAFIGK